MSKKITSPIVWQGSKTRELIKIRQFMPHNCDTLCDAFGGGGAVSYGLEYKHIIYNDLDKHLYQTMKRIQTGEIKQDIEDMKSSIFFQDSDLTAKKELFKFYSDQIKREREDGKINSVVPFIICCCFGFRANPFGGMMNLRTRRGVPVDDRKIKKQLYRYEEYGALMKNWEILNCNALDLLNKYKDSDNVFIYLDPPYLDKGTNNQSYIRTPLETITEIIKIIKDPDYKCRIMLHVNFSGFIYINLKDYIKDIYPHRFPSATQAGINYFDNYQVIITNYRI